MTSSYLSRALRTETQARADGGLTTFRHGDMVAIAHHGQRSGFDRSGLPADLLGTADAERFARDILGIVNEIESDKRARGA